MEGVITRTRQERIKRERKELLIRSKAIWVTTVLFGYALTIYSIASLFIDAAEFEAAGGVWTFWTTLLLYAKCGIGIAIGVLITCIVPYKVKVRAALVSLVSWTIALVGICLEVIIMGVFCTGKVIWYGIGYVNGEALDHGACLLEKFRIREERRKYLYERDIDSEKQD